MVAKNDITNDNIQTKVVTEAYRDGWDRIFDKENKELETKDWKIESGVNESDWKVVYEDVQWDHI